MAIEVNEVIKSMKNKTPGLDLTTKRALEFIDKEKLKDFFNQIIEEMKNGKIV